MAIQGQRRICLWVRKAEYLDRIGRRLGTDHTYARRLANRFASIIVQIHQLWVAYRSAPVKTVACMGEHFCLPDGEMDPLSEEATYLRLIRVGLEVENFEDADGSVDLMLKSCVFRTFSAKVDQTLKHYAPRFG